MPVMEDAGPVPATALHADKVSDMAGLVGA